MEFTGAHLRVVPPETPTMVHILGDFAVWLQSWGASQNTIDKRISVLQAFLAVFGDPAQISTEQMTTWLATPTFSAWTRVTYYGHLRSFFSWAVRSGRIPTDPTLELRPPRAPKGKPRPLPAEDVARILDAAEGDLRAWLLLGMLAGLRVHEVAKLRGEDVDANALYVVGKGNKAAMIPTHPELWALAQEYPRYGWWFPRPNEAGHVSGKSVTNATTRLFRRLGIEGSHHRCRHTYGTNLLRGGANIRVVQTLMRHESLATTEIYTQVDEVERQTAIASLLVA